MTENREVMRLQETHLEQFLLAREAVRRGLGIRIPKEYSLVILSGRKKLRFDRATGSLNTALANRVCHYKSVLSQVLRLNGVRSPENAFFTIVSLRGHGDGVRPYCRWCLSQLMALKGGACTLT